jgi:uncharacterized protein YutE (UPF0331/DUF86 family)
MSNSFRSRVSNPEATPPVDEVAQGYAKRGYRVVREPNRDQLPPFLHPFRPDLLAVGPAETVVVEFKRNASQKDVADSLDLARALESQPGWRYELILSIAPDLANGPSGQARTLDEKGIATFLLDARNLLAHNPAGAVLVAWAAIEASLRQAALAEGLEVPQSRQRELIGTLYSHGRLSREEWQLFNKLRQLRNNLGHGYDPDAGADEMRSLVEESIDASSAILEKTKVLFELRQLLNASAFREDVLETLKVELFSHSSDLIRVGHLVLSGWEPMSPKLDDLRVTDLVAEDIAEFVNGSALVDLSASVEASFTFLIDEAALVDASEDPHFEIQDPDASEHVALATTERAFECQLTACYSLERRTLNDIGFMYAEAML